MLDRPWKQSPSDSENMEKVISGESTYLLKFCHPLFIERRLDITYLFIWVHASETPLVARFAALFGDFLYFLLRSVGEVAGVGIFSHGGRMDI